ncbi:MAG TPA: hypothetical protein VF746_00175 [Longimicrobium sp.]
MAGILWATGSAATADFYPLLITGALLGTALWRPVELAWGIFIRPLTGRIRVRKEAQKLIEYRKRSLITQEQFYRLMGRLVEQDLGFQPESNQEALLGSKLVLPSEE